MTGEAGASGRIVPFGERAWLLDLGDVIDEAVNARILAIADAIEERRRDGLDAVERPVVAYASLLLGVRAVADRGRGRVSVAGRRLGSRRAGTQHRRPAADRDPGPLWRERRSRPRQRRGPSRSRRRSRRGSPYRHDLPGVHARVRARLRVPRYPPGRAEPPAPRGTAHVGASGERRDRGPPDGRLSGRDARWLAPHRPDRSAALGLHPRTPPARLAPGDRVRFVAR